MPRATLGRAYRINWVTKYLDTGGEFTPAQMLCSLTLGLNVSYQLQLLIYSLIDQKLNDLNLLGTGIVVKIYPVLQREQNSRLAHYADEFCLLV